MISLINHEVTITLQICYLICWQLSFQCESLRPPPSQSPSAHQIEAVQLSLPLFSSDPSIFSIFLHECLDYIGWISMQPQTHPLFLHIRHCIIMMKYNRLIVIIVNSFKSLLINYCRDSNGNITNRNDDNKFKNKTQELSLKFYNRLHSQSRVASVLHLYTGCIQAHLLCRKLYVTEVTPVLW